MRALALALWMTVVVALGASAAPWETTRRGVIDPLNGALHRHLPTYLRTRDLTALLGLYATESGGGLGWDAARPIDVGAEEEILRWDGGHTVEPIRGRWERLLALLPTIERAELRIDDVFWRETTPEGTPATARLIVRGTRGDGARAQLEQAFAWRVAARDGHWVITSEDVTARTLVARHVPRFEAVTDRAGIENVHASDASPAFQLFGGPEASPVRASSGSAVADVDHDGCEDVVLAGNPELALYRNHCDGTFEDWTASAGLPRPYPAAATGVVFLDYDNDGWADLFVAAVTGGDRLFRNAGGGRFVDVSAAAGIPPGRWAAMATVADYDRDGFLDVYVVRMGDHERTVPEPNFSARNGVPNTLLRNRRDGTFEDVSARAGVDSRGWDLAGAWGDYDGDGWPDLYVANEFGGNVLFHNERDGTFRERADEAGVTDGGAGMGVAWADYDADGDLDLYVSNMHANSRWALFHPEFPSPIPWQYRMIGVLFPQRVQERSEQIIDGLTRGSSLYRNDGNGRFTDVSDATGLRDAQWGWAAEFLDYDDDGRLDLFVTNGFISGPILDDV
jgi:hypothetical protein